MSSEGQEPKRSRTGAESSDSIPPEIKANLLEQRLQEVQSSMFDSAFGDRRESSGSSRLYLDPLLALELATLRQANETM